MNSLLSANELQDIRNDLSRVTYYYNDNRASFVSLLGSPSWSEAAFKAAWSVYVAHHLSNYGQGPRTLKISVLLDAPTIMCSQYSTVALHLFSEFSIGNNLLSVIGWDDSVIGDHSQLLFDDHATRLLLDPTVGLIVEDVTLAGLHAGVVYRNSLSFLKDDSLMWYSDKIVAALHDVSLGVWDLTYSVPGFTEWLHELNNFQGATIDIGATREVIVGTKSQDVLNAGVGADYIYALGGSDILIGGPGIDGMYGGSGNDRYYVDNYLDKVRESKSPRDSSDAGGIDKIISSVSCRLPSFVEHATLIGSGHRNIIGNVLNNNLYGNTGNNKIYGGSGSDRICGGFGADSLFGGKDKYADVFLYLSQTDSTMARLDSIFDFVSGVDKLDVSAIDADVRTNLNERFAFAGTKAEPNAVWFKDVGLDVYLHGDINGDLNPDFSIRIVGVSEIQPVDLYL